MTSGWANCTAVVSLVSKSVFALGSLLCFFALVLAYILLCALLASLF